MKILIVTNSSGGLYKFRKMLIEKLLVDNEVIAYTRISNSEDFLRNIGCVVNELPINRRGMNPITDYKLYKRIINILKREKPGFVITYTIKPNIYAGLACRKLKIPYAVNITGLGTAFERGKLMEIAISSFYKVALKKARVVFFENEFNRDLFVNKRIIEKDRTCLLSGAGVDLRQFSMQPYPSEDGAFHFLFMGRIMKEKGIEELFLATKKIIDDGYDVVLDVLGGYEENYKEAIERYAQEGWLHYHGYQNDVRPFIQKAHCFVLPSYHEGMANTNLECAASGRPIITSNIPGCKEAVIEGKTGFTCEPQNVESLYDAMKKMINLGTDARAEMGKLAREHMIESFDKEKVVEVTISAMKI